MDCLGLLPEGSVFKGWQRLLIEKGLLFCVEVGQPGPIGVAMALLQHTIGSFQQPKAGTNPLGDSRESEESAHRFD
jgi:hypothetical protein